MSAALNLEFSFDVAAPETQAPWELSGVLCIDGAAHPTKCRCRYPQSEPAFIILLSHRAGLVSEARRDPASQHGSSADRKVQRRLAAKAGAKGNAAAAGRAAAPSGKRGKAADVPVQPDEASEDDAASSGGERHAAASRPSVCETPETRFLQESFSCNVSGIIL